MEGGIAMEAMRVGFVLAEAVVEDGPGRRARETLGPGLAARLALDAMDPDREVPGEARIAALRSALPSPDPTVAVARLPRRGLALLAPFVPREVGAAWLAGVAAHRPGYHPPPDLLTHLHRVVLAPLAREEASPWRT